ncbi:stage III sporulation protein AF [Paenibacillus albiflavus]|uniref:Stage III sporulation protein AF n=1 Tax=Paenibacillus albiflavus TaxID=2545760 RepID=A0A4R4EED8_9BACL|nr:stage III sporulation protein AF [Paenibacillus albiflavus]TCZ77450.1 stage III sporulation protein AF [Paenibacillus albiflavus]
MQWFHDWLKMVITVVMFAAFIDLLLPNTKMQRYVKTVLSLFILLTLLSPVLELLRSNWNVDQMLAEAEKQVEQKEAGMGKSLSDNPKGSLQAINEQGLRLKDAQDQQATLLAEKQIAEGIKETIRAETAYEAEQVIVLTATDTEGKPYIKNISVVMHDKASSLTTSAEPNKSKSIEPVKPVDIQIRVDRKDTPVSGTTRDTAMEDTKESVQAKTEVKQLIGRNWSVPSERIEIRVEAIPKESKRG